MRSIACFFLLFHPQLHFNASAQSIKITLLGTGVPQPSVERFGPSTSVEEANQYFLFDCGRGAAQRIWQQKIPLGNVNRLFFTHFHSDHRGGIVDLSLTDWISTGFGGRKTPLQLLGPAGTKEMMQGLKTAYSTDSRRYSCRHMKELLCPPRVI